MLFEKEKWYEKPWFAVCAGIGILLAIAGITIIGYTSFYVTIVGGICWVLSLFGMIAGITIIGYTSFYVTIVGGICWVLSSFGVI